MQATSAAFDVRAGQRVATGSRAIRRTFPGADGPGHEIEDRMRIGNDDLAMSSIPRDVSFVKLSQQVLPFELQLTRRRREPRYFTESRQLRAVEGVAADRCLGVDLGKIRVDRHARRRAVAKSPQLRVVSVTDRTASQNGSSEQRFAPKRHQPFGVEIPGVKRPESHDVLGRANGSTPIASIRCPAFFYPSS